MTESYHSVVLDNTIAPRTQPHPGPDQTKRATRPTVAFETGNHT